MNLKNPKPSSAISRIPQTSGLGLESRISFAVSFCSVSASEASISSIFGSIASKESLLPSLEAVSLVSTAGVSSSSSGLTLRGLPLFLGAGALSSSVSFSSIASLSIKILLFAINQNLGLRLPF